MFFDAHRMWNGVFSLPQPALSIRRTWPCASSLVPQHYRFYPHKCKAPTSFHCASISVYKYVNISLKQFFCCRVWQRPAVSTARRSPRGYAEQKFYLTKRATTNRIFLFWIIHFPETRSLKIPPITARENITLNQSAAWKRLEITARLDEPCIRI